MHVEFSKFKRFFVFGCSFTSYKWPMWGEILASEMPNIEYYNFGKSGSGNLAIAARVAEANNRFKFNETDLVMVHWSSYHREDRFKDYWETYGGIYGNIEYTDEWHKKYASSDRGYVIRDLALIELTTIYLQSLKSTHRGFLMLPPENNEASITIANIDDITAIYQSVLQNFPKTKYILDYEIYKRRQWQTSHTYINQHNVKFNDSHPSPKDFHSYLNKVITNLTSRSLNFAIQADDTLKKCKTHQEIISAFEEHEKNITKFMRLIF